MAHYDPMLVEQYGGVSRYEHLIKDCSFKPEPRIREGELPLLGVTAFMMSLGAMNAFLMYRAAFKLEGSYGDRVSRMLIPYISGVICVSSARDAIRSIKAGRQPQAAELEHIEIFESDIQTDETVVE